MDWNLFFNRVNRLLEVQLPEQTELLKGEIKKYKRMASANGTLGSGATVRYVIGLCERNLNVRAVIVWKTIVRVYGILGCEYDEIFRKKFKEELKKRLTKESALLKEMMEEEIKSVGPQHIGKYDLVAALEKIIKENEVEIDLFFDNEQVANANNSKSNEGYNFYGNIGIVQTGDFAEANLIQNMSADESQALKEALTKAKELLADLKSLDDRQKTELTGILEDINDEIESDSPNNSKIKSLIYAVAVTLQTIPAAQKTYDLLKIALLSIGITLP